MRTDFALAWGVLSVFAERSWMGWVKHAAERGAAATKLQNRVCSGMMKVLCEGY